MSRRAKSQSAPVSETLNRLAEIYPHAHGELHHENAFQLLIATILSAQTTDVRVNQVTPELFRRFPTPQALAGADLAELEEILRPLGFFRSKARSIHGTAVALLADFAAEVPGTMEQLLTLPGVGRKTANVVLGDWFGVPGITVDTHVGRIARRWGWTASKDPVQAEKDLANLWDPAVWTVTCHRMIFHGRALCQARKPQCDQCPLLDICPQIGVV
ncbi:MAG: endonuclease III [Trueperella sp.]|nr:endonuclease III [Trueperella sp.]